MAWETAELLTSQPSRAITKEGPEELRLALYQAANVARSLDPQLASFYRRLMVERGHCHTQANCALARKRAGRIWATLTTGSPYELRDLEGKPITPRQAKELASSLAVPEEVRRRARSLGGHPFPQPSPLGRRAPADDLFHEPEAQPKSVTAGDLPEATPT